MRLKHRLLSFLVRLLSFLSQQSRHVSKGKALYSQQNSRRSSMTSDLRQSWTTEGQDSSDPHLISYRINASSLMQLSTGFNATSGTVKLRNQNKAAVAKIKTELTAEIIFIVTCFVKGLDAICCYCC